MTRAALILLLVATNAFWLMRRVAEPPAQMATDLPTERESLRAREAALRSEIESLVPRAPSPSTPAAPQAPPQAAPSRPTEDWGEILRRTPEAQRLKMRADLIRRAFDDGAAEHALLQIGNSYVPGDAAFRGDIVRCLDSSTESVRQRALYALRRFPPSADETARLLELSRDPEEDVRAMAGAVLVAHVQGPRGNEVTATVVRLLREPGRVSMSTVSWGLWAACPRYPPELEEALLATEGALRSEVYIQAFRYMDPKSDRVLEALLKSISEPDGPRYAEALMQGVPPRMHARIIEIAFKLLRTRQGPRLPSFDLLARYGTAEDADTLQGMLADDRINRKSVEHAIKAIRKRVAGD